MQKRDSFTNFYNAVQFMGQRMRLLESNFVTGEILREIIKKNKRSKDRRELELNIYRLAGVLNIRPKDIQLLLSKRGLSVTLPGSNYIAVTDKPVLIAEPGLWIKFNPWVSKKDFAEEYVEIAKYINNHVREIYPYLPEDEILKRKKKNQSGYRQEKRDIKIYKKVEAAISNYWDEDKGEPVSYQDPATNTISTSVVKNAIEEVVGSSKYSRDKAQEKYREAVTKAYYTIAERYRLPTITDISKLKKQVFEADF